MNVRKMVMASCAVFIAFQAMDFIVHNIILMPVYQALSHLWRSDMMSKMWIFYVTSLIMSFLFVYIFIKGHEKKGLMEGVRFGFVIGLFMNVVGIFGQYAMYAIPFSLALQWFAFAMIEFMAAGALVAFVYRTKS